MIPALWLLYGAAGIAIVKGRSQPGASIKKNAVGNRPTGATITERDQVTARPSSAQAPRADQGNQANQPWYTGPAIRAIQPVATSAIKTAITALQASSLGEESGDDYSDEDFENLDDVYDDTSSDDDTLPAENDYYEEDQGA